MNTKPIGEISQINRYPVKSFTGERLNSIRLESYGLLGDRSHAFVDPTKEGWERYITARQIPEMLSYRAELDVLSSVKEFPMVKITGPDGRVHQWDEQFHKEIQRLSKHVISTERFSLDSHEQLAVDDGSILIITDRSLKRLEQLWGKPLDERRFRANFLLKLYDDVNDHEPVFIGKHLTIGNVELNIQSLCERCSMITIDPDKLERDPSLLKSIHENMNLYFGMYADVVRVGVVQVGDLVYATEK
jgi:uncharacterized protein YcbX